MWDFYYSNNAGVRSHWLISVNYNASKLLLINILTLFKCDNVPAEDCTNNVKIQIKRLKNLFLERS